MYELVKKLLSPSTSIISELPKNSKKPISKDGFYCWKKGEKLELSAHFTTDEFSCKCSFPDCIDQKIHIDIIENLENIRTDAKQPIYVTSAFRCSKHQAYLRSAGLKTAENKSQHELGQAVDIVPKDHKNIRTKFLDICAKYFEAIGLSDNFLHLDRHVS